MAKKFSASTLTDFGQSGSLEWLETNGLGGYASATVAGSHSRRYHGLLVAAMNPPVGRTIVLSKLEETIVMGDQKYELSANQYPGTLHPQGFTFLKSFERGFFPQFEYEAGGVRIRKTICMVQDENTTVIVFEVLASPQSFKLNLSPLCSSRDYHGLCKANDSMYTGFLFENGLFRTKNYQNSPELFISVPGSSFSPAQQWYFNFEYAIEQNRGLDFREDLFNHGVFEVEMNTGDTLGVILSTQDPTGKSASQLLHREEKRRETLIRKYKDADLQTLLLAADQFIVRRGTELKSVIAGYHWFSDWGRDTMIALPGLCLTTERFDDARKILSAFSQSVSDGMLPNRFPDNGETPEYNTVDATLWYFIAVFKYFRTTRDEEFVRSILPVLTDIIDWHYRGTRYNIHVEQDELLFAGQDGVQLTWMDAKVGDWVVTPRKGKVVEINALWYNALRVMSELLGTFGEKTEAKEYLDRAERVSQNFVKLFWNNEKECLFDYVDGDYKNADIRPNQLYALSLPFKILSKDKAQKVLKVAEEKLLTPRGLRSLSADNPEYKPVYQGNPWYRDGAYHQGTVWSHLMGTYIDALIEVKGSKGKQEAGKIIRNFLQHLDEAGVGTISEIFDGDTPHQPRGCMAQAWSVAEILRVMIQYDLPGRK